MRCVRIVLGVLMLLAGAVVAAGPANAAATGAIAGIVTGDGRAAVPGVRVFVADRSDVAHPVKSTVTDAAGHYTLRGVPADSFFVLCFDASGVAVAPAEGYLSVCGHQPWGGPDQYPDGTHVLVQEGQTTRENLALTHAGGVSGRVVAAGGAPLAGVVVRVGTRYDFQSHTTTASDGTYHLRGVIPGAEVAACFEATSATGGTSAAGYFSQCWKDRPWKTPSPYPGPGLITFRVQAGEVTTDIGAVLRPAAQVAGTVRADGGGTPLGGVAVILFQEDGTIQSYATTADDGSFLIGGLHAGADAVLCVDASYRAGEAHPLYRSECWQDVAWDPRHDVRSHPPGTTPITVTAGARSVFDIGLARTGRIEGTVTSPNGAPIAGVRVGAYVGNQLYDDDRTDASGHYVIAGLFPDSTTYAVCFWAGVAASAAVGSTRPGGFRPECHQDRYLDLTNPPASGATAVTVTPGATTTVDAVLTPGVQFTGTVRAAAGGALAGVTVLLLDPAGTVLAMRTSDVATGRYDFAGLAPRTGYRVCVLAVATVAVSGGYASQCNGGAAWSGALPAPTGTVLGAVAGTSTTVDFALPPSGSIDVSTGARPAAFQIVVFDAAGRRVGRDLSFRSTQRLQSFRIVGLAPDSGPYRVCVASAADAVGGFGVAPFCADGAGGQAAWDGADVDVPDVGAFAVTAGGTTAVPAGPLAVGSAIGGTVSSGGVALPGARVSVFAPSGTPVLVPTTGADGTYRVLGLNPATGPYRVCASAPDHRARCWRSVAWSGTGGPPAGATGREVTAGQVTGRTDIELPPV